MSVEGPAHDSIVARLAHPEINLAAWGGIVFPLALIIESPVVMLLSASTALSRDWDAYRRLRRIAMALGGFLTLVHIAIAFTPIYDVVVRQIIQAPEVIIEPGRIGLMIMTPWCWAIAYRRFQQGALIRFGHARAVGMGTVVRITFNGSVLLVGYFLNRAPGIVVAASAVAVGVVAEAIYAGLRIRSVVRSQIRSAPRDPNPLTVREFISFYVPLALTSLISFFVSPIGSAAMSRMPNALPSLAAWPVVSGLLFILRSPGLAYNEATLAMLDRQRAFPRLKRFATFLACGIGLAAALVIISPLSTLWLTKVMALPSQLAEIAQQALWLALLLPPLALLQSWFQAIIVHSKRTRGVTESVVLYFAVMAAVLGVGVARQSAPGLSVAVVGMTAAALAQVGWLYYCSRPAVREFTT
jgi:hypothetical protein